MIYHKLKIGGVELANNVLMAPLAGFTDIGFRSLARICGAGLTYTEMVSAKALHFGNEKTEDLLYIGAKENPVAVQIFGNDPCIMAEAVQSAALAPFDIIDINMGCPMSKIVKNGEGAALLNQPELAYEIVRACVASTSKPITVKMRIGWDSEHICAEAFAEKLAKAGVSAITVHGRTAQQLYSGRADWSRIASVVQAVDIPVVGNGDIVDKASAMAMLEQTGCAGIMLARGALGNPTVFCEILGSVPLFSKRELVLEHIDRLSEKFGQRFTVLNMRKHLAYYLKGVHGSRQYKDRMNMIVNLHELKEIVCEAFSE